jgi:hypothetical protein
MFSAGTLGSMYRLEIRRSPKPRTPLSRALAREALGTSKVVAVTTRAQAVLIEYAFGLSSVVGFDVAGFE